jgi:DNA-binding NarL/FixJ family response regulator
VTRAAIEESSASRQPPAKPPAPPAVVADLTPAEREEFDLLAPGLSNAEICARLVVSEATAKAHVARILQKLGLREPDPGGGVRLRDWTWSGGVRRAE